MTAAEALAQVTGGTVVEACVKLRQLQVLGWIMMPAVLHRTDTGNPDEHQRRFDEMVADAKRERKESTDV